MPKKKVQTKDDLSQEISSEGYYKRARIRASRRKSPWNLILIPFSIFGIGSVTYYLFRFMWRFHTFIYPAHKGRFSEFWHGGDMSFFAGLSSFLLMIPILFAAMPLGLMIANCIAWCIPPARNAFEREAKGHKHTSFANSMHDLFKISIVFVPICLLLSLLGALTLWSLK